MMKTIKFFVPQTARLEEMTCQDVEEPEVILRIEENRWTGHHFDDVIEVVQLGMFRDIHWIVRINRETGKLHAYRYQTVDYDQTIIGERYVGRND